MVEYVELTGNPRHDKLISLVMSKGYISNEELAKILNVTPQTIRRDIRQLSDAGIVSRHHGGAGRISSLMNTEFSKRETAYTEEKTIIANEVANFIPDGATLFITMGTTVEFVAKALKNKHNLRVITNSIRVANILYQNKGFEVITLGGILHSHNGGIVGPSALLLVSSFRADYLITSLGAVDYDGVLLDVDINEVAVVKAMIEHSRNFILIGDHTKFHSSSAVEIGNLKQVSTFITDSKPPANIIKILKENKVELRIAKK